MQRHVLTQSAILEVTLDADFLPAAEAADREPAQVVADLMHEFVERQRAEYRAFLQAKVDAARADLARGDTYSVEEVEAEFAEMRRELRARPQNSP